MTVVMDDGLPGNLLDVESRSLRTKRPRAHRDRGDPIRRCRYGREVQGWRSRGSRLRSPELDGAAIERSRKARGAYARQQAPAADRVLHDSAYGAAARHDSDAVGSELLRQLESDRA